MSIQSDIVTKKDFMTCVREAKSISITERKEYNRASKSNVIRNRLIQLYSLGAYSNRQIADILGVNYGTVIRILKEPDIKQKLI